MMKATLLTANAARDVLSEADYRDIYEELRGFDAATGRYAVALDGFVEMIQSAYSKASWSKYHRGELALNRTMRGELRRVVGLAALPLTVGEAVGTASPDAEVWQIGEGTAGRVLLVSTPSAVRVTLNGRVEVEALTGHENSPVTDVVTVVTARRRRCAVSVPEGLFAELNGARQAAGLGWTEFLRRLL